MRYQVLFYYFCHFLCITHCICFLIKLSGVKLTFFHRPIVSNIGTDSNKLVNNLLYVFSRLLSYGFFIVKHSLEFVKKLHSFKPLGHMMVHLDVTLLFT